MSTTLSSAKRQYSLPAILDLIAVSRSLEALKEHLCLPAIGCLVPVWVCRTLRYVIVAGRAPWDPTLMVFGGFHFCCDLCRPGGLGVSRESYDIKSRSTRRYVQYQTDLLPMDRLWQRTTKPAPMPAPKPTNRTESPEPIDSSPISRDRLGTNSTSSKAHPASTPHHPQSQQDAPVFPVPAIPKTGDDDNDDPIQKQQQQQPFNLPPLFHDPINTTPDHVLSSHRSDEMQSGKWYRTPVPGQDRRLYFHDAGIPGPRRRDFPYIQTAFAGRGPIPSAVGGVMVVFVRLRNALPEKRGIFSMYVRF